MEIAITVVIWITAGLLCYSVAAKKGRDPTVAIAMGLLFGLFALIYYILAKGSRAYEVKRAKEIIKDTGRTSITNPSSEESADISKDSTVTRQALIILAIIIIIVMGAVFLGAVTSNNSSSMPNSTYRGYNNSFSNTTPSPPTDYKSLKGYPFPEVVRSAFKQNCIREAGPEAVEINNSYCSCMLYYIEQNYSLNEFSKVEQEYLKTGEFPPDIVAAANNCLK